MIIENLIKAKKRRHKCNKGDYKALWQVYLFFNK